MKTAKISTSPTQRILPTHELNARRRRKKVLAPQTPDQKPAPKGNAAAREADRTAVGHLYSQFPQGGSLA